ncbi:Helix-turn-helix domain-containing protein [Pseudomonas sp. NFACC05-1]|nr:Helix-turn-helix domain-containing protein [Pseudomonas sp. NFACC05-1]
MAKKFSDLMARRSPDSQARAQALYQQLRAEMPLHELRQAQELSQEALAKTLHINQAAVSKMERRTDMYISTLRNYIRAMGGNWRLSRPSRRGRSGSKISPIQHRNLRCSQWERACSR